MNTDDHHLSLWNCCLPCCLEIALDYESICGLEKIYSSTNAKWYDFSSNRIILQLALSKGRTLLGIYCNEKQNSWNKFMKISPDLIC